METYTIDMGKPTLPELGVTDTVESVIQGIRIILTTPKGSVPMYREFGINMDFLDMPYPGAEQIARSEIREAIERWEPRATVRQITFQRGLLGDGSLIPTVEVEIHAEES